MPAPSMSTAPGRVYPRSRAPTSRSTVAASSAASRGVGTEWNVATDFTYPWQRSHTSTRSFDRASPDVEADAAGAAASVPSERWSSFPQYGQSSTSHDQEVPQRPQRSTRRFSAPTSSARAGHEPQMGQ